MIKFADGNISEGNYEQGKRNGQGVYKWVNGDIYDGDWQAG